MHNIVQAEFMKLRRKKLLLAEILIACVMPAIVTYYAANISRNASFMNSFTDFYKLSLGYMSLLILPIMLGILATMIFSDEYKYNTMKELSSVPVSKYEILISKIITLFGISLSIMMLTGVLITIGALVAGGFPDVNFTLIVRLFALCLYSGLLTPLAMLPIVLIITISKKGFVLPISISVAYVFFGYIAASSLVGIHPVSSAMNVIWYNNFEGITIEGSIIGSFLNILVVSLLCLVGSLMVLNKQEG
ncbi:hypothetical protein ASD24_11470 [Paenibacillus sp. Root52]|uniref:ABC transporter permease n=1 Tax=Paenibacillus sp. Root52 TaxID=1736552 RepID=UPI0006F2CBD3|nr:ABC transporter permease [Paenibacillus sp. Root52]KQY84363.1 hypothetical protein ASD24_11470 [Paenibacillus sp. Root52]